MFDPSGESRTPKIEMPADGLAALFGYVSETVLCCDERGFLNFVSGGVRSMLGYDPGSVVGRNLLEFVHPDDVNRVAESIDRWSGRAGTPHGDVLRIRTSDSAWKPLRYDAVLGADLGVLGSIVITLFELDALDVDERAMRHRLMGEDRLVRLTSAFLEVPFDRFDEGLDAALVELAGLDSVTRVSVWLTDGDRRDRVVRRAVWSAPANAPSQELARRARVSDLWMLEALAAGEEVHLDQRWSEAGPPDRERRIFRDADLTSALAMPMVNHGRFTGFVMLESTIGDVAFDAVSTTTLRSAAAVLAGAFVRHETERRLAEQARTDRITGLGNRWAFDDALAGALAQVGSDRSPGFGLALVDLDRFKLVNDSMGHVAGDRLLAGVASRLQGAADGRTVLARLGGDELLVLLDRSGSLVETYQRVEALMSALDAPFTIMGEVMRVTASVGVVHVDHAHDGPGELLRRADVAMYKAKNLGGHTIDVDDPDARAEEWLSLRRERELRDALAVGGLEVHYQGEWDIVTGKLLGAEALVRWDHPTDGLLVAGDFVPLAEERGLIDELGRFVLREACRSGARWAGALPDGAFLLRVNLAADQLRDRDLPERVGDELTDAGLAPEALCLELTESMLLTDPVGSAKLFERLRADGIGLAIDDFGTGYSSILQLKRLPLTALKIDRSFVSGLPEAGIDRAIVRSTIQLAEALGVTVTAEGVETEAQCEALVELGCTRAQGFLFARPEPAAEFTQRVDQMS